MSFRALVLTQGADRKVSGAIETLPEDRLPAGDVTVAVEYSTLNYKDGLVLTTGGGLVKTWPHVGGIDFAGTVEASDNPAFKPGDKVVLNGWRVGELHWGGYATKARVKGDWLVKLPAAISTRRAMAIGTAGYTSMLCVMALEKHGLDAGGRRDPGDRCGGRRRLGRRRDPGQARLRGRRRHRPAAGSRLPEGARRGDDHGSQGARRGARPAAAVGALRRRGRHGVGRDVRQGARPGEVRRRGRGLRPRRRSGVPRLDPALHPARRDASTASIR